MIITKNKIRFFVFISALFQFFSLLNFKFNLDLSLSRVIYSFVILLVFLYFIVVTMRNWARFFFIIYSGLNILIGFYNLYTGIIGNILEIKINIISNVGLILISILVIYVLNKKEISTLFKKINDTSGKQGLILINDFIAGLILFLVLYFIVMLGSGQLNHTIFFLINILIILVLSIKINIEKNKSKKLLYSSSLLVFGLVLPFVTFYTVRLFSGSGGDVLGFIWLNVIIFSLIVAGLSVVILLYIFKLAKDKKSLDNQPNS